MCGICGIFEYRGSKPVDREQLQRMTDTLWHRGPDEQGVLSDEQVGLGMRRLRIIDLAGGQQPIPNEDESVWIIFNGEIYNYQPLQKQLIERGHKLRTRSDTEVILHLYEEYGDDCVNHLDGMFAFAIYDQRPSETGAPRLLLARDRLGKKPLYYADVGGALIFGSEIKPILQDRRVTRELDYEALHQYLSLSMIPAPLSIFKDIRKLPAGHHLTCDGTGIRIRSYWNYLDHVGQRAASEDEAIEKIRRLLFEAVEKRLIAEVPLGAFLSGGLDSSAIVAIMSRLRDEPVKTFSIGFDGPKTHNELPYARALAEHYRTEHHEFLVKPDIIETVQEMVNYADEPFGIAAAIPTYIISKAARQHVTVVLTGDGGDEMFGGYSQYTFERWAAAYRRLPLAIDWLLLEMASIPVGRIDSHIGRWRSRIARFTSNARRSPGERRLGWASGFSEADKQRLYNPLRVSASGLQSTYGFLEGYIKARNGAMGPALQQNCMDILVWLADEMLTKVDRMTMAASLEARCPLLDWRLVEYLAGLSFEMKVPGWRSNNLKHLLRRAVADIIPAQLLNRPKQGFNVPLDAWFRGGARSYLESVLSRQRIKRRGLFDADEVASLLSCHQAGQSNANNRLYALLVFEVWAEAYL